MKWLLLVLSLVVGSVTSVRGDAAGDLYNQGTDALAANQYDVAAQDFDKIITGYPSTPTIDDVRIRAGFAYLHLGKFDEAIDRLSKEAVPAAKPQYRGTALYFTGLAQFSKAQKITAKADAAKAFGQASATLKTLIDYITAAPSPDNQDYKEDAMYYRALAEYQAENYDNAEADLLQLIQAYPSSLKRPDYLLLLGSLYAIETNAAVGAKKPAREIQATANKALAAFDRVSTDPNALVQANDANMSKAEILFLIAQLDSSPDAYDKVLEAFRQVRRKDDMIPLEEDRLAKLKKASQTALQNSGTGASLANDASRLIEREEGRLNDLKNGPDPIIQALIRIGECYVTMKQPDEARTVFHRLIAHAKLTPDQQQEVDFQILYSYVLGGQTDKADAALTDYLSKHASDPQADSISFQIASKLMERKDYAGALTQADRSLKDFPSGKYVADVIALKAQALTKLGRIEESDKVADDFLKANSTSPVANQMFLTKAQSETTRGDFKGALTDFQKVKNNASASPELQAAADAGYIQTLNSLQQFDDVISEAKIFATKYPTSKALPSVLLFSGMAMDQKHDPGAVAALQAVAKQFPKDEASPFALFYIVNLYQRANNSAAMIQAASDLRKAYPDAYALLVQAADAVSAVCLKQKKFDDAIALYQPLIDAPKPDVAANANNKIGGIWLAATKALGYYQSMPLPTRAEAEKRLSAAEQSYVATLKKFPDQLDAVDDAFIGLDTALKQRRSWGVLKDPDLEGYLGKLGADLTSPDMPTRLELAKAGLVFVYKDGAKQYPAALDRFKKAISANTSLRLTRQESNQYGELLIAAQDYPTAIQVYTDMLNNAAANDAPARADALYGLGAACMAQGDTAKAATYFAQMKALPGGAAWHPHIQDVNFALALEAERTGDPSGLARQTYAVLMASPQGGITLQAKAMLGYGRLLEKAGYGVTPSAPGTIEFAVHYYQEPHTLFGPAAPAVSAEGLFDAGQTYEKAGDKANAKKQYDDLLKSYGTMAPDWAAKAQAAEAKLGA